MLDKVDLGLAVLLATGVTVWFVVLALLCVVIAKGMRRLVFELRLNDAIHRIITVDYGKKRGRRVR